MGVSMERVFDPDSYACIKGSLKKYVLFSKNPKDCIILCVVLFGSTQSPTLNMLGRN
jgi:hypothetical protein